MSTVVEAATGIENENSMNNIGEATVKYLAFLRLAFGSAKVYVNAWPCAINNLKTNLEAVEFGSYQSISCLSRPRSHELCFIEPVEPWVGIYCRF
jgi:hypothetical protein